MSKRPALPPHDNDYPNGRTDWVEVRVRVPPAWRDWYTEASHAHACSLADEIRYVLGHWKSRAEKEG